jgi:site-specific recombinase XerD
MVCMDQAADFSNDAARKVIDQFCHSALQRGLSVSTVKNYRSDLEGIIRWASSLGRQLDWATFLRHGVEEYRGYLRRGARGATANRNLSGLRAFLDWAAIEILDRGEPIPEIRRIEVDPAAWIRPRWLNQDEQNRLIEAVHLFGNEQTRAMIMLLLFTGLRTSELCQLRWKDVHVTEKRGVLIIHRASADIDVELPLNRPARQSLIDLGYPQKRGSSDPVLPGRSGPLTRRWVEMMIRQHGERAGLSDVTPLSLRHTFIANMLELGVSPVIISDHLGDRAMDLLRYYAPLVGEDLTVAVERMAANLETRDR